MKAFKTYFCSNLVRFSSKLLRRAISQNKSNTQTYYSVTQTSELKHFPLLFPPGNSCGTSPATIPLTVFSKLCYFRAKTNS